jgi:hypothetical protein
LFSLLVLGFIGNGKRVVKVHRGFESFLDGAEDGLGRSGNRLIHHGEFLGTETGENMTSKIRAHGGAADADAEARDLLGSEVDKDRLESPLASGSPLPAEADGPGRKGDIIGHHEHGGVRDTVKAGVTGDGLAAEVHEGRGFDQDQVASRNLRDMGVPLGFLGKDGPETGGQHVENVEAGIVPRSLVFPAGIPEARDEAEPRGFGIRHGEQENPGGLLLGSLAFGGLFLLDDLGSLGGVGGGRHGLGLDLRLGDDEDGEVGIGGGLDTGGQDEVADVEGLVESERADIDADDLGEILGKTLDAKGSKALLEQSAEVLHAVSLARGLDRNLGVEHLVHGDLKEIDVEDVTSHGMVLDFLDQGELVGNRAAVGDDEFDKDVLADRMGQERRNLALLDLEVGGLVLVTVDNRGNQAAGAEMLDGIASEIGAGARGKFDLFSHGFVKVVRFSTSA